MRTAAGMVCVVMNRGGLLGKVAAAGTLRKMRKGPECSPALFLCGGTNCKFLQWACCLRVLLGACVRRACCRVAYVVAMASCWVLLPQPHLM